MNIFLNHSVLEHQGQTLRPQIMLEAKWNSVLQPFRPNKTSEIWSNKQKIWKCNPCLTSWIKRKDRYWFLSLLRNFFSTYFNVFAEDGKIKWINKYKSNEQFVKRIQNEKSTFKGQFSFYFLHISPENFAAQVAEKIINRRSCFISYLLDEHLRLFA